MRYTGRGFFILMAGIILSLVMAKPTNAQNIPNELQDAFKSGNAETIANYFSDRIKLSILEKQYEPSKAQAKEILRDFFLHHPPTGFEIRFESEKPNSHFFIASLNTAEENYRINIFFKHINGENKIHLLKIERNNERSF